MKRSRWKGPYISNSLIINNIPKTAKILKTTSRNSVILPFLIGKKIQVYNGKFFIPFFVREEMVGHKFGEFIFTRLRHIYKKKKKKK